MKKSALTILALLAMTSVTFGVSLNLVPNASPGTGLDSYTLRATGTGIVSMTQFSIVNDVNQVWTGNAEGFGFGDPTITLDPPSIWLGDDSAVGDAKDSYVIFGNQRIPDLSTPAVPADPENTIETNPTAPPVPGDYPGLDGIEYFTYEGMGTLNNKVYAGPGVDEVEGTEDDVYSYDAYLKTGLPATTEETLDLMQLVVATGTNVELAVRMTTLTGYTVEQHEDPNNPGVMLDYAVGGTVDVLDLAWPSVGPTLEGGDTDGDGDIDGTDLANFSTGWYGPDGAGYDGISTVAAEWLTGDFDPYPDGDGDVDGTDLSVFSTGWYGENGSGYVPPVGAVPEPSTIVMLILGTLCLFGYRTRK